ncbi:hypothetical protein [Devosia pacifica]|nr:hypothetical protein [Devosia pacifica]
MAVLIELGIDEKVSIEKHSFDQLIGELRQAGIKVPSSGTLKAMNRQRVIIKHYGQPSEDLSAFQYFQSCSRSVDSILKDVFGKTLQEINQSEYLREGPARNHVEKALEYLNSSNLWDCICEIRKAIFIEIEVDYDVKKFADPKSKRAFGLVSRGWKAPYFARSSSWISENVRNVFEYVQIDYSEVNSSLLQWSVNTEDFWNLRRLTPHVYQDEDTKAWCIERSAQKINYALNRENVNYCVDTGINILVRKQRHQQVSRYTGNNSKFRVLINSEKVAVRQKADLLSDIIGYVYKNREYDVAEVVPGFDGDKEFARVFHMDGWNLSSLITGYVDIDECTLRDNFD